jgi:endoglucanase
MMLKELTEASGAPGREEEVAAIMERRLKKHVKVGYDGLGSLIAEKKGSAASPRVMLAGHMDEVAFMVTDVSKEGYLRFRWAAGGATWRWRSVCGSTPEREWCAV